ncbi:MAG: histidine kinase [Pedobacter sp.]|nr:MAG: histidine kinase [Pedobacter sp.]
MKANRTLLLHVIGWTVFLGYLYGGYLLKRHSFGSLALEFSITLVQMIEFYICLLWVFPKFLKRGKVMQLIGGLFIAMSAFIFFRYLIEEVAYPAWFGFSNYRNATISNYVLDNIYFGTSFIVVAAAVYGVQYTFENERKTRLFKEEAVRAELAFLKSQINPHFLYNTLNYIYSLAIPVSNKLATAVVRLSDLMRYTLSDSVSGKVPLSKEIAYIESYISLFSMRFEPDFHVKFNVGTLNGKEEIAPLLLIPFVENAFKHGVVNDAKRPININLKVQHNTLRFELSNKVNHAQKDYSSGIGLVNIQRRLQLIYPDQHELLISNNGNTYKITLNINL